MSLDVDAATAGSTGQLGVLPRRQVDVRLAVPLHQRLEDHTASRHVDAERKSLGGEDDLHETLTEQLLHDFFEHRQHAGVVRRDTTVQRISELAVTKHAQVVVRDARRALLHHPANDLALVRVRQPQSPAEALQDGRVAPRPAEDEDDGRQ